MSDKELRPGVELRAYEDDDGPVIEGTAIVFGQMSEDIGFREIMEPGSVTFSDDVVLDFDHQTQYILGRQSNGTLDITTDEKGVHFRARPPKTTWVSDLLVSMREGFINQCSFMFRPQNDEWSVEGGEVVRHITDALVMALSVVSMPAYPQTSAQARSIAEAMSDAAPTITEDTVTDGGSPDVPSDTPGSGERVFLAGGRLIALDDSRKE